MLNRSIDDELELVVGWLPAGPGGSLSSGARSLMPALLYADKVTVICPQSDDALEMSDYFELDCALPKTVTFEALDSAYLRLDAQGRPETRDSGQPVYDPYAPRVFQQLADKYASQAQERLAAGRREDAMRSVARLMALTGGAYEFDLEATLAAKLPGLDQVVVAGARAMHPTVRKEVVAEWLLGAYTDAAMQPRRYALLDDPSGVLRRDALEAAAGRIGGWSEVRSVEVSLSAAILRRLPSPGAAETWDAVADVRRHLNISLRRFRGAMAELSVAAESHPLDEEFEGYTEHVWRTRVTPALDELEQLVREASLRSVFFNDALGDLSVYAGPLIGIGTAVSHALPTLASAAIAGASPVASTFSHRGERRRSLRKHDFLFLHEAARRLDRR